MKPPADKARGKRSIDLIEESVHLLRAAPASTLATYYVGAIPFVIGFLYFWTDMSSDPFAAVRIADKAAVAAVLFIWMKFCQAAFARQLRNQLSSLPVPRWTFRQNVRVVLSQLIIQSSGFFLIPLAILLMAPFGWVYAFYQNVTALADPDWTQSSVLVKKALRQTSLWPVQNHLTIAIVFAFGFFVFLNVAIASLLAPGFLKQFLGIESVFSRSSAAMLNTTFLAAACGLTYLCIDPLVKTVYALRCFYGESLETGEDLKASMKQFEILPKVLATILLGWLVLTCAPAAFSATQASVPTAAAETHVSDADLNRSIDEVIQQRKYAWRLPRESTADNEANKGVITKFLDKVVEFIWRWLNKISDWIGDLWRKLFAADPNSAGHQGFRWITSTLLLYVLMAAVLLLLIVFIIRVVRNRRNALNEPALVATPAIPDLSDENVSADQLPEDGWTALARQLLNDGQFRLAMRAFYLASLAHLARRKLIGIARFKSNRDYERELRRRGHAIPALLPAFGENLAMLERVWYGTHEVDSELVREFSANVDRIRSAT